MMGWLLRRTGETDPRDLKAVAAVDAAISACDSLCVGSRRPARALIDAGGKQRAIAPCLCSFPLP